MRVLILCAGLGTRLKPLTDDVPKCMIEIAGKPVLQHLVDHVRSHFARPKIMINVHHKPEKIMEYFGDKLIYLYEPILLGDIETTKRITTLFDGGLLVMNGDTLTDLNLQEVVAESIRGDTSIASFDGTTYTGTTYFSEEYPNKVLMKEFGCYWQDMGTPEGLAKAREKYESEANLSKLL